MSLLTRDQILKAADLPTRPVAVPAWGGTVLVRSMTAAERDAFEADLLAARQAGQVTPGNIRARFAAACIVDDSGQPLFTPADVEALGRKSAAALDAVYQAIVAHNALSDSDIEDLAKN